MADFSQVTSRLFTGAAISGAADVTALINAGVTAVIDLRAEQDDTPFLAGSGMAYLWNPAADDGQSKPADWFGRSLSFALPLLAQPRQKVNCHCAAGVNRGPSTAYMIMRALGWTAAEAEAVIRAARPQVGLAYKGDADAAVTALGYA